MSDCLHKNFAVLAEVIRVAETEDEPPTSFMVDVMVSCVECNSPFTWLGLPLGAGVNKPHVSMDGKTLRAPVKLEEPR